MSKPVVPSGVLESIMMPPMKPGSGGLVEAFGLGGKTGGVPDFTSDKEQGLKTALDYMKNNKDGQILAQHIRNSVKEHGVASLTDDQVARIMQQEQQRQIDGIHADLRNMKEVAAAVERNKPVVTVSTPAPATPASSGADKPLSTINTIHHRSGAGNPAAAT